MTRGEEKAKHFLFFIFTLFTYDFRPLKSVSGLSYIGMKNFDSIQDIVIASLQAYTCDAISEF